MRKKCGTISSILTTVGASLGFIVAIIYVMSAYGGVADPMDSAILPLLGLGFPITLALMLVLLAMWLCLRKWWIAAMTAAAILAGAGPLLTFSPLNVGVPTPATGERTFKVLTYNVMNFTDYSGIQHEPNRTIQYILDVDADCVCLQEAAQEREFGTSTAVKGMLPLIEAKYPYIYRKKGDVVLFSKYPFTETADTVVIDKYVRARGWRLDVGGMPITVLSCHLESIRLTETDKDLYRKLTKFKNMSTVDDLEEVRETLVSKLSRAFRSRSLQAREIRGILDNSCGNVILCGDFNDTPGSFAYRTIMGDDMRDAYADCALGPTITYHSNRFFFRIDHILYRGNLTAVDIERGKIDSSDHYPLIATFRLDARKQE